MATDLETLRTEIEEYLKGTKLPVFRGFPGLGASAERFYWNIETHPDFRSFVEVAKQAGAPLIVFNSTNFNADEIEEAFERLEYAGLTRDEVKSYENRLKELQKYEGFTSMVELSFVLDGCTYEFRNKADWYVLFEETLMDVDANADTDMGDDDDDDDSMSGYFSNN